MSHGRRYLAVPADWHSSAPVSFDDFDQPSPGLPSEDSAVLRETIQRIMAGARPQARAICGLIWEGKVSQKEIGDELGMTSRSVEGHMRRLRTRAKALGRQGGDRSALPGDTARRHVRLAYRRMNDSEGWSRQMLWS
ncbi:hypothetical protein [Streptomyces mirabilis]